MKRDPAAASPPAALVSPPIPAAALLSNSFSLPTALLMAKARDSLEKTVFGRPLAPAAAPAPAPSAAPSAISGFEPTRPCASASACRLSRRRFQKTKIKAARATRKMVPPMTGPTMRRAAFSEEK